MGIYKCSLGSASCHRVLRVELYIDVLGVGSRSRRGISWEEEDGGKGILRSFLLCSR